MPLITVNLKDPGGLISHFAHVSSQAARALKRQAYADLVFFCRSIISYADISFLKAI